MENTKNTHERIQELEHRLNNMHHSWILITAAMWTEEEWAEERALEKKIIAELEQLIPVRKAELEAEQAELECKYPKFSHRLKYIFRVPKKVTTAEKRHSEIAFELRHLEYILK